MAITAWSAKVWSSDLPSLNGKTSAADSDRANRVAVAKQRHGSRSRYPIAAPTRPAG